jgi:hypothetical protein
MLFENMQTFFGSENQFLSCHNNEGACHRKNVLTISGLREKKAKQEEKKDRASSAGRCACQSTLTPRNTTRR